MITSNPVTWFEIYVDNLERAKLFYQKTFNIELADLPNPTLDGAKMLAFPHNKGSKNGTSGALVCMRGIASGTNSTVVYFHSEDCSVEEARIPNAGGKVINGKTPLGAYGFVLLGEDTEGNIFGIHSIK